MRAITLLSLWKLKNWLRTLLTDPRKLIPFLLILLLLGFFFGTTALTSNVPPPRREYFGTAAPHVFEVGISLLLVIAVGFVLKHGLGDGLLALARPDVDYIFPSPISRRVVLAYRLPTLIFSALFQSVFQLIAFKMGTNFLVASARSHFGTTVQPAWVSPVAVWFGIGIYLNLTLLVAMQFPNRDGFRRALLGGFLVLAIVIGFCVHRNGLDGLVDFVRSPGFRVPFYPAALTADVVFADMFRRPIGHELGWLSFLYTASFIPMFLSNANWYEQSIVSTERMAAFRQAAQSGFAALMAARAETHRHKATRTYTVHPFGEGAMALVWAHLCSAAKRPGPNFVAPTLLGIGLGAFAAATMTITKGMGVGFLLGFAMYSGLFFLGSARTASEAAVRRRELVAPLPIPGWTAVAANLAVPMLSVCLFGFGAAIAYSVTGFAHWPYVLISMTILFPLYLGARMVLQYTLVLGYPDLSDKIQQLISNFVYWIFALPLFLAQLLVCVPAILLRSIPLGLASLILFQVVAGGLLLVLAGKASERAIATGEPVHFLSLLGRGR